MKLVYSLVMLILGLMSVNNDAYANDIDANTRQYDIAREGAPSHVSEQASIMEWEDSEYVLKHKGSNAFTCLIWADIKGTFEPSCFNPAALVSVLPVYTYQRRMLEKGTSIKQITQQISAKAKSGEFPPPAPGALVYMMSKRNKFYHHHGEKLIDVEPHIMLYFPRLEHDNIGFNADGLPDIYDDFPHLSVIHLHGDQHSH